MNITLAHGTAHLTRVRSVVGLAVAGMIGALLVVAAPLAPAQATPSSCANLLILAHRGYHNGPIAENTLKAMDGAASRGYMIETDIRADSQGQLWIFHDRDVSRATYGTGNIDQLTTAQVSALRYRKGNGTMGLPTLQDAISHWQSYAPGILIYPEPKTADVAQQSLALIDAAGLTSRVYYTAFQSNIHALNPAAKLMARISSVVDPQTLVAQGYSQVQTGPDAFTSSDVDAYHAKGIGLLLRTTDITRDWRKAISVGFDGILTDYPDDLKSFCPGALLPPQISSFSPTGGAPGTTVTITGNYFSDADSVTFGSVSSPFSVDSATQITTSVPSNVSGDVPITVHTPNGGFTSSQTFHIPLAITSFSPASGPRGSTVTISGEGFSGTTSVRFGSLDASYTVNSDQQISATVPATAPAASKISVRTASGSVLSATSFRVPPTLSSFTPPTASAGSTVTITGSALTGATAVKFGTVAAASYTVDSDTQISAVVPSPAPQSATLKVTTAGGTASSSGVFNQVATPVITGFSPVSGGVGTAVTVSGSGFTGATAVSFGTVAASSFTVDSDAQITAVVPAAVSAKSVLKVTTPGGTAASADSFALSKPVISGFTPGSGPVGSTITITGTYLTGATSLTFGTVAATFSIESDTQITATVPSGSTRSKINLKTAAGSVQSTSFFTPTS